jgi:hypothetical protein
VRKGIKYNFAFCASGDGGEKRTFDSVLTLKHFIQAVKYQWPTQNLLWPPNFMSLSCGPLETWHGPLQSHIIDVENHCSKRMSAVAENSMCVMQSRG